MFIGIDIGNTSTTLGIYTDGTVFPEILFRYSTDKKCDEMDIVENINNCLKNSGKNSSKIQAICFSSVVPEINEVYHMATSGYFKTESYEIRHDSVFSIDISYSDIQQLGIDRIVNVEAAFKEYGPGCIIIDIGTAATFDVLDGSGKFDGGLIAPGIGTTIKALADVASNLPKIVFEKPDRLVARDTENAIKSGFYFGWLSLLEGLIERIRANYSEELKIIFTGGLSEVIIPGLTFEVIHDSCLTMKGIKYIYDNNKYSAL